MVKKNNDIKIDMFSIYMFLVTSTLEMTYSELDPPAFSYGILARPMSINYTNVSRHPLSEFMKSHRYVNSNGCVLPLDTEKSTFS